MIKILYFNIYF